MRGISVRENDLRYNTDVRSKTNGSVCTSAIISVNTHQYIADCIRAKSRRTSSCVEYLKEIKLIKRNVHALLIGLRKWVWEISVRKKDLRSRIDIHSILNREWLPYDFWKAVYMSGISVRENDLWYSTDARSKTNGSVCTSAIMSVNTHQYIADCIRASHLYRKPN